MKAIAFKVCVAPTDTAALYKVPTVDVGALPSASGGDFVEAELLRITAGSEIDEELARIKSEVEWPKLAGSTEETKR